MSHEPPRVTLTWRYTATGALLLAITPTEPPHDIEAYATRLAVVPTSLLDTAAPEAFQPTAGAFTANIEAHSLTFEPRHPFLPGRAYTLALRTAHGSAALATIAAPEAATDTVAADTVATVLDIYPTAVSVPLNLLRLYIQFSHPMSEAQAARNITVRRLDTDEALRDVFLPQSLELWDPTRTRLTLLLDPGRIKRGLLPHQQMGYPLVEGVPIEVTVAREFRDAAGRPLAAAASRRYEVIAPFRARIDLARWHIAAPAAGTRDALVVTFDRPLDRALLAHCIEVRDASHNPLPGTATIAAEERAWHFTPYGAWQPTPHTIEVDPLLEDLAGNSLRRVFDRDLTNPTDTPPSEVITTLHFTPRT